MQHEVLDRLAGVAGTELLIARDSRGARVVIKRLRGDRALLGDDPLVMDVAHGKDLRKLLRHAEATRTRVPLEQVIAIVAGAAAGLHHAHAAPDDDRRPRAIVHRDVSPTNILVGFDGRVRVIDFGVAETASSSVPPGRAEVVDQRADVFALGVVLYELATMRRLFGAASRLDPVVPPSLRDPAIPAELDAIALRALAPDPGDRFQTVDDLRDALISFAVRRHLCLFERVTARYLGVLFETPVVDGDERALQFARRAS